MEAILALEDGRVFRGRRLGSAGEVLGEVVFNTGMTGYQEILTDPSYRGQLVTLTVPHVGNTGINPVDIESERPQASGLIIRERARISSSWRAEADLHQYLKTHGVVGIDQIDTRALTRHLRSGGVLRGCLSTQGITAEEAVAKARKAPRLEEQDLVGQVTCREARAWDESLGPLQASAMVPRASAYHIVAMDFGIKHNILRCLRATGARLTLVPARTRAEEVLALDPDGVFLSNGPGDPAICDDIVAVVRELLGKVPIFGICLGHQLIARALGASTYKLKFGHRGTNHPVRDERSGRVWITSQNHGYAVDPEGLPAAVETSHVSLYDGTLEGLRHLEIPLFSVQFHPEAAPGPHDAWGLFEEFIQLIEERRSSAPTARRCG